MKQRPTNGLHELKVLSDQLKVRAEQDKLAEQKRQAQERATKKESAVFRSHMGGVTPIKAPDIYLPERTPSPKKTITDKSKKITTMSEAMTEMEQWSDEFDASFWQTDKDDRESGLSYAIKGSNPDLVNKLCTGQWPVQAFLDLHGLQRDQARSALADFLRRANQGQLRCVCVIHGKGINSRQPAVLPTKVRSWLCQSELVQAFCPANPRDGGEGALYVLLIQKN